MNGGKSIGDPCQAYAYHGYNGIEAEVVEKIKNWMRQPAVNDGELTLPKDYQQWPKFLSNIQRPDNGQVREIYMSPQTKSFASREKGFANGSVFVMENYAAQKNADGSLQKDAQGQLVKGSLLSVFMMGKGAGWGDKTSPDLKNGNWIYTAFTPTGEKGPQDLNTCRQCHLPLSSKDFVHRYDDYWNK